MTFRHGTHEMQGVSTDGRALPRAERKAARPKEERAEPDRDGFVKPFRPECVGTERALVHLGLTGMRIAEHSLRAIRGVTSHATATTGVRRQSRVCKTHA